MGLANNVMLNNTLVGGLDLGLVFCCLVHHTHITQPCSMEIRQVEAK